VNPTEIASAIVLLSWAVFAVGFILRPWRRELAEKRRDPRTIFGFFIEAVGYALVFFVHRGFLTAFLSFGPAVEWVFAVIAALLGAGSVWLALAAINVLGKHWSPAARIIEGHELVTEGPYRLVRHPIYAAMLGLMVATGLVISKPWALGVATVLYLVGTTSRIRIEERLLVQHFGDQYEGYKSKVRALIPFVA
jgi:protein-S-isoprenylcysteine O-methyltransferase Ste14